MYLLFQGYGNPRPTSDNPSCSGRLIAKGWFLRGLNYQMLNYVFHNLLSAFEFECFSRDLINAHEGLGLANFAEGRDGGIDLRYSQGCGKSVIVQAKRYKNYSDLIKVLRKEVEKVRRLNPQRYMITTTVDLTPANKQEIISLFTPFIHNEHDIWAKQDLNKFLAQHPDVERQYYKLWLTSTNILNTILNKNIFNWTDFEKDEIQETIRTYVMNDSFNEALKKLIENRYVVISGEPGIGKTTLARVLVMHFLSEKYADQSNTTSYEEFYYTNCNIEDLVQVFQKGKRQVFFYDDFLGKVTLEEGEKNFDSRIIAFIRACQHDNDKLFILATREYILQQGLVRYSRFNEGKGIEMSKCVVDMGKYTRFVKAQILYNHLVANEIPQPYVNAILHDKNYMKIIDHRNFSPRIIETFLTNGTHEQCQPEEYFGKIKGFFDYPDSVWLDAFERLSDIQKEALLVLTTMGTPMMYDLWKEAYDYFFNRVHKESNYLNDADWNNVVKVLQNNFIKIGKDHGGMHVEFHNPGVDDVLTRYISSNESVRLLLLENAYFIEQAFGSLCEDGRNSSHSALNPKLIDHFYKVFERLWDDYRSCYTVLISSYGNDKYYRHSPKAKAEILFTLVHRETLLKNRPYYVETKMSQDIMEDETANFYSLIFMLKKVDLSKTDLDLDELFQRYTSRLYYSDECLDFAQVIKKVFPKHTDYLLSKEFCSIVVDSLKSDLENAEESDLDALNTTAEILCKYVPELEQEYVFLEIKDRVQEYSDYLDAQAEAYQDDFYNRRDEYMGSESWKIDNLFATIRE